MLLRRALLTSIPGAAITSVKISGIKHKFSTIAGVKENVVDLLLNIKGLNFRLLDGAEKGKVSLSVKGCKGNNRRRFLSFLRILKLPTRIIMSQIR